MDSQNGGLRTRTTLMDLNDDVLREILDSISRRERWQRTMKARAEVPITKRPTNLFADLSERPQSDLVNFCTANRRLRGLGMTMLFRESALSPYFGGLEASSSLESIGNSTIAARLVRSFSIVMYYDVAPDFGIKLCSALQNLPSLHSLTLVLPEQSRNLVWTSFKKQKLCCPQVQHLAFMPYNQGGFLHHYTDTVLSSFPGATSLYIRKVLEDKHSSFQPDVLFEELLTLIGQLQIPNLTLQFPLIGRSLVFSSHIPHVVTLHITEHEWNEQSVIKSVAGLPQLSHLKIGLKPGNFPRESVDEDRITEEARGLLQDRRQMLAARLFPACEALQRITFDEVYVAMRGERTLRLEPT